ncbi:MAG: VanZ family protein [Candidatus Omnitrophica bacterium]|nr:VanZ family protein [Candidatus Omnitrophota bacterium]
MDPKRQLRRKYWVWALGWTLTIYATLYLVRPVCEFLKKTVPFDLAVNIVFAACLSVTMVIFFRKYKMTDGFGYVLLLLILSGYAYGLATIPHPEEKIHFIEYGILAYLVFRALRLDHGAWAAYVGALALTAALGWVDEGIQHLLPKRYYQTSDVVLNAVSGLLGLLLVYVFSGQRVNALNG